MDQDKHLPLAPRDLLILSVLAEGPLHGYGIIKAVEFRSRSGVLLDPANLYRVLRRMTRLGWIRKYPGGEDATRPHGRGDGKNVSAETPHSGNNHDTRRKTYEITRLGQTLLASELTRLERLLSYARPAFADGERS